MITYNKGPLQNRGLLIEIYIDGSTVPTPIKKKSKQNQQAA